MDSNKYLTILKKIIKEHEDLELVSQEDYGCKMVDISKPGRLETKKEISDYFDNV